MRMRRCSKISLSLLICVLVALFGISPAIGDVIFTKIADTNTAVPGGAGRNFTDLSWPTIDCGNVAFKNSVGWRNVGIYMYVGGNLIKVADENTRIPNDELGRNFKRFGIPSIDGENVAFWGQNPGTPVHTGIYMYVGGNLTKVADQNTAIPDGSGNFDGNGFNYPFFDGGNVVFAGGSSIFESEYQEGIYMYSGGNLTKVVDLNTPTPDGTGNFTSIDPFSSLSVENVAFGGLDSTGQRGVYVKLGGENLTKLADQNTAIPDGRGNFTNLGSPSIDGGNVAFTGRGTDQAGIYTNISGSLCVVANRSTQILPDQTFFFTGFGSLTIDGGNVAFKGTSGNYAEYLGIFTNLGGSLMKVIDLNDTLDGKSIKYLYLWPEGLSGNQIAFHAVFSDGSEGIYVATITPEMDVLIDEEFPLDADVEADLGFTVKATSESAVVEIVDDPSNPDNGLLRLQSPPGSSVSVSKVVSSGQLYSVCFAYKFVTEGKLEIILGDRTLDTIVAPESGPGRDSFAEYSASWILPFQDIVDIVPFMLRLSNVDDPELFIDYLQVSTTSITPEPSNFAPVADSGPNIAISSEDQNIKIIQGTASDPDNDPLTYKWLEGETLLKDWANVGSNGEAYLDLSIVPYFSMGEHILTLEVNDGQTTSTDDIILTVNNSGPHPAPTGGGIYEINTPVNLGGQVSDFDGDLLDYSWLEGEFPLFTGQVKASYQGDPVNLPEHTMCPDLGIHTFTLRVNDEVNAPVQADITVTVQDTGAPTLHPEPDKGILWPPNHEMVDIVVEANASDDSGSPVTLTAVVTSNEPIDGLGDEDTAPDWAEPAIDQETGTITLQLRAERSGSGDGRVYTITITATDESNNSSEANIAIIVPHDKRK